jgi:biopolymer transport protein ExbD/biopolymer transport protein TolR
MTPSDPSSGRGGFRPLADINVTPLVDVMLVLLVVFMITAPLLASGLKLDLPAAAVAKPLDPKKPIPLSVAKDGRIAVGTDPVTLDTLVDKVRAAAGRDPAATIQLRGDRETPFGDIVAVMDRLAGAGLTRIAIVTDRTTRTAAARSGIDAPLAASPVAGPPASQAPATQSLSAEQAAPAGVHDHH